MKSHGNGRWRWKAPRTPRCDGRRPLERALRPPSSTTPRFHAPPLDAASESSSCFLLRSSWWTNTREGCTTRGWMGIGGFRRTRSVKKLRGKYRHGSVGSADGLFILNICTVRIAHGSFPDDGSDWPGLGWVGVLKVGQVGTLICKVEVPRLKFKPLKNQCCTVFNPNLRCFTLKHPYVQWFYFLCILVFCSLPLLNFDLALVKIINCDLLTLAIIKT